MKGRQHNLVLIGKKIRNLRKQQGFSQEGFADHVGLARTYMGRIERGEQNISIQGLIKIAFGLKVELRELLPELKDLKKC